MHVPTDSTEFHESTLRELVNRLGTPPPDVIAAWRSERVIDLPRDSLPDDFQDWDLDELRVTANACLKWHHNPTEPLVATPAEFKSEIAANAKSVPTQRRSKSNLAKWLVVGGLSLSLFAAIVWANRPRADISASSASFPPQPITLEPATPPRQVVPLPTTEPLETFDSIHQNDAVAVGSRLEIPVLNTLVNGVDPRSFALESLLPPTELEVTPSTASAPPMVASTMAMGISSAATASVSDVLAAGDDAPPPESPQAIQVPVTSGTVSADPLVLEFDRADQQPTWDLGRAISVANTTITVSLTIGEDIEQGWIEPLEQTPVRRARGIVVLTTSDEESVAVGIRLDPRTGSKLSLRLRFVARLDPTLPWQPLTREGLLRSLDYLGQQSLIASTQAEQIEAVYSQGDSAERSALRDQRDMMKMRAARSTLLLGRCGELVKLVDKIEATAYFVVTLSEGDAVVLKTMLPK